MATELRQALGIEVFKKAVDQGLAFTALHGPEYCHRARSDSTVRRTL